MNTKTLILSLFLITSFFSYLVVRKMRSNASRAYEVILWNEYNICFLVGPEYKIKRVGKAFSYQAGKNSGVFSLKFRAIDPTMKASSFGDFDGAYSKEVDFRVFEYDLGGGVVLHDRFDFAKKGIPNLLPVRENCTKYLDRFPVKLEL